MKLSNNSIGMLIFIALATTVFVLMVLRPVVDGNAMNLGVPMSSEMAAVDTSSETDATIDTATEESQSAVIEEVDISEESVEEEEADKATEESPSATIPTEEIIEEAPSESTTTD